MMQRIVCVSWCWYSYLSCRWQLFRWRFSRWSISSTSLPRRQLLLAQSELFDNELIDFIIQITNAYAIEANAVGWVPIDINDICCFLIILMLSGYVQLPSYKMFWEETSDVQQQLARSAMPQNKFCLILKNIHFCDNGDLDPAWPFLCHEHDIRKLQKICYNYKKCQCRWVRDSILWEVWTKTETTTAFKAHKIWL